MLLTVKHTTQKLLLCLSIILSIHSFSTGQTTDPNELVTIQRASQNQINNYDPTQLQEGMLVYNTDLNRIFEYTDTGWLELQTASNVFTGFFTINNTGTTTVTGIPFQPNQITFVAHANVERFGLDNDNQTRNNDGGIANAFGSMNGFARNNNGTITQGVIYVGGSGNSINDISRYSSNQRCIGIRYSNQNGDAVGRTLAALTAFTADGFTLNVTNRSDNVLVFYTAYR